MWRTRAGYAGGDKQNPTYHDLGDQTECFEVDFDPSVVSYEELLDLVFTSHDPTRTAFREQYASLVLTRGEEQSRVARETAARFEAILGRKLATRIEPLKRFWLAEDYHQKYYLRNDRTLMRDFHAMFGADEGAFVASTAAARVNGYVARDGAPSQLAREIDLLGLSEAARAHLEATVGR